MFNFKAKYVAELVRRRFEIDELTKQLLQWVFSDAIGSKKQPALHSRLELHKAKADLLKEAWQSQPKRRRG